MTTSIFEPMANIYNYPMGLMNLCVCGQVVLAPATEHESCRWCDKHNCYAKECKSNHINA